MVKNKVLKALFTLIITSLCTILMGQGNLKKEGEEYFKNEKYAIALNFFDRVKDADEDIDMLFRRAICNYHINKVSESKGQLTQAYNKGYREADIYYYMAKTQHATGDYAMAVKFYKRYLNKIKKDKKLREEVIRSIKQCAYGINNQFNNELAFVENLGDVINTVHDDLNPLQSRSNSNKYYFSSGRSGASGGLRNNKGLRDEFYGTYFYDIYSTEIVNGSWEYPKSVDDLLNTSNHELMLDLNRNGSELYFLRTRDLQIGSIVKETFGQVDTLDVTSETVVSPVVGELGDVYLRVFNDSTFIFASNRVGGYGGYDLYMTIRRDNEWSDAINLGPEINGPFNEIAPFITNDGKSIYFSSDRLDSYGGYDIFSSAYTVEGSFWSNATNLGMPINSPGNDTYYTISADGNTAMLSSDRKSGFGGYDIYIAYLKDQNKSQLIASRSIPFVDYLEYEAIVDSSSMLVEAQELVDSQVNVNKEVDDIKVNRAERAISISPLFYGDDDNLFQPKNNIVINDLIDLMRIYPEVSVQFTSHSIREGLKEFDLYFSIKRAEKMQEYFGSKGIDKNRIKLRGAGSSYPLVKEISAGQSTNIAKTINRRLDVDILGIGELPITVVRDNPVVVDYLQDNKFKIFETLMDGVSFRVKIAQVKQLYKNDILADFEDVMIDQEGEFYVYTVGLYSDFFSALRVKNQLANKDFNPKIRAYYNGIWMTELEIQEKAQDNVELQRYIDNRN